MGRVVGTDPKLQAYGGKKPDVSQNEIIMLHGVCGCVCVKY